MKKETKTKFIYAALGILIYKVITSLFEYFTK